MRNATGQRMFRSMAPFLVTCLILWLVAGIFLMLDLPPGSDLAWFNPLKGSWTDVFFQVATRLGEFHGYALATVVALFFRWKEAWWIPLTGLLVTLVSYLAKSGFHAPRPGHFRQTEWFMDKVILVDGVKPLSGMTSFPSGHTMGAFALAFFCLYFFRLKGGWGVFLALVAAMVGLSRLYLVMHFLEDVLLGSVLGVMTAAGMIWWHARSPERRQVWES